MSSWDDRLRQLRDQLSPLWMLAGVVLFVLLLSGPIGGVDFTGEPATLDGGNASVTVVEPTDGQLTVSEGRFGTNVTYVRVPDAVLDVERVSGRPRVVYTVSVPGLVDQTTRRYVESTGRLRVPASDRALERRPAPGVYDGHVTVRIQSFSYDEVVINRTVEVVVE